MDHANEQVLLLGVSKKLDIHFATMMADHCKACYTELIAIWIDDPGEAPVHLVCFSGISLVATTAVTLWINELSLCRNQILMLGQILLDGCLPTGVAEFSEPFKADRRVRNALL